MQNVLRKAFNFVEIFLKKEDGTLTILGKGLKIILIFLIIKILIKIVHTIIDKTFHRRHKNIFSAEEKKINTLTAIFKNIVKYLFYFIGLVMVLDIFGIDTSSILATAGIGGLAIGFAAQSLVKDIITGFFILSEDQFSVGDYIKVNEFEGIVEQLGVRVTKLRDFSGELHIIPNSNINTVTNKTRGAMRALINVSVDYEEDIDRVIEVLNKLCVKIGKENNNIVEGPTVLGVNDLADYGMTFTIVAKTKPMEQWSVERELRKAVKEALDRESIEIPYPKHIVYNKED